MGLFSFLFGKKKNEKKTEPSTQATAPKEEGVKETKPIPKAPSVSEKKPTPVQKEAAPVKKEVAPVKAAEPKATPTVEEVKNSGYFSKVGRFEIKRSRDDRYVFNLYAPNRVIVATSQVYSSAQGALTGIKSVMANADRAPIEDQTLKTYETLGYPKWEMYCDKGGQYRFRLLAPNGSCICHSQGYTSKASCKNGIESIIKNAKTSVIDKAYLK